MLKTVPASPASSTAVAPAVFWRRLRVVAFWSVLLGISLEFGLLALTAAFQHVPEAARAVAQVTSKVTWSFVVCLGISCGLAAAKSRVRVMGLLGLLSGPAGFTVARAVHKGVGQVLSVDLAVDPTPPLWLAGLKAVEYGIFGLWIARITLGSDVRIGKFIVAGSTIGVACGAIGVALFAHAKPDASTLALATRAINEVVFPIGCALVVFVANRTSAVARV